MTNSSMPNPNTRRKRHTYGHQPGITYLSSGRPIIAIPAKLTTIREVESLWDPEERIVKGHKITNPFSHRLAEDILQCANRLLVERRIKAIKERQQTPEQRRKIISNSPGQVERRWKASAAKRRREAEAEARAQRQREAEERWKPTPAPAPAPRPTPPPPAPKRPSARHGYPAGTWVSPWTYLGVSVLASKDEIKAAYHRLAKECHPDLISQHHLPLAVATEEFQLLQAAYSRIS